MVQAIEAVLRPGLYDLSIVVSRSFSRFFFPFYCYYILLRVCLSESARFILLKIPRRYSRYIFGEMGRCF